MDWGVVDEGLIGRGELLLSLDFLESYDLELSVLNFGKVGRPYRVTYMYVVFLALWPNSWGSIFPSPAGARFPTSLRRSIACCI